MSRSVLLQVVSASLSLSHILILMTGEYIVLMFARKHRAREYIGLILLAWIISIIFGAMNPHKLRRDARIGVAVFFISVCLFVIFKHISIVSTIRKKTKLQNLYRRSFLRENNRTQSRRCYWKLKYFTIIIISYLMCATPWLLCELKEGFEDDTGKGHDMYQRVLLVVYRLNFYPPSVIWIYLKVLRVVTKEEGVRRRYRYKVRFTYA